MVEQRLVEEADDSSETISSALPIQPNGSSQCSLSQVSREGYFRRTRPFVAAAAPLIDDGLLLCLAAGWGFRFMDTGSVAF
ncbi:MAG TPA: hypothetical protein VFV89_05895 [Nocardioides sp.]|uniref:hypothetical protein n=1 Tax=Nocardioides sp. TaxID=35761 RepID=UPI002E33A34D|nr:hypothetical protein [Nocardioides sp.]HEX5087320.1 hypothetical protein [Nocardioides sp.]